LAERSGRDAVKVALTPHGARKPAGERRPFDHGAKQLTLARVDPDVRIRDAIRVDQAPHDDARADEVVLPGSVLPNHISHRASSEPAH